MGDQAPGPAIRLVVNEELQEEDVRAMIVTGDLSRLESLLKQRFKNPVDVLEKKRLAMLGWLIKRGFLEVRVGVMRKGEGIVHAKFGIMTDQAGDSIVFSGSGNESARGLLGNYERLEISTSWEDQARYQEYNQEFTALWGDNHPDVHTVTLPEALRLKLIKFAPKEPPILEPSNALARQKAAMVWRFIMESPYIQNGGLACDATALVDSWPHQKWVVEETAGAWPEGRLLCDEVGMGKTIEAILILRRLLAGRGVRRALILLPAGLLKQWQGELREKGGLIFPRLEGVNSLVWPDEKVEKISGLQEALEKDVLLMSRETARTENNLPIILAAPPWDLVVLDESHAARRRKQEEGEFNSGTLLLDLLHQLQLSRRARGFLLLSATPMQTHPWEPWDLLAVLGEGDRWLADFAAVRDFYQAVAAVQNKRCDKAMAKNAAVLIKADERFPSPPGEDLKHLGETTLIQKLVFPPSAKRQEVVQWLRCGAPLARRMHRNTRETLRRYYQRGLLSSPPPKRTVEDIPFDFSDSSERRVYDRIKNYIDRRYEELEREKSGKGFVMTVYRRRASSSHSALECSLERRREGLRRIIDRKAYDHELGLRDAPEDLSSDELPEGESSLKISASFPNDPQTARAELNDVDGLLEDLRALRGRDTKRDRFFDELRKITEDGRAVLVFTEYVDTMEYLRDTLITHFGKGLGCYSGRGGERWDGNSWKSVTKDEITKSLHQGEFRALICTDAASEGLNLQAAGALINYDLPWNPSKVEQRIGRIDRIGQKLPEVRVVNLLLKNSVDEQVYKTLRTRCGLFEHFVGPMQPVLAKARKMLLGEEKVDPGALETAASQIEQDALAKEAYIENSAEGEENLPPSLTRSDLEASLLLFNGEFGPRTQVDKTQKKYKISVPGQGTFSISSQIDILEQDRDIFPLSFFEPRLKKIAESLTHAGERLPLVIGSHQRKSFRSSSAYWVGNGEVFPINSLGDLKNRLEGWDGDYPDPKQWLEADRLAGGAARRQVDFLEAQAAQRERDGLKRQISAARIRLLRELGRFLACLGEGTSDLNGLIHRQISRDIATAHRLRRCLEKLGGYPEWPPDICREVEAFADTLSENQCRARLLGKEIDAALDDPRWLVSNECYPRSKVDPDGLFSWTHPNTEL
ncbi:MAG: helicase-related protein [Thermodesulfobacteriota bacterium]|nr:helicase-related protein [Thermodesulfobacteriota bacterium]